MSISRIFQPVALQEASCIELDEAASHHLGRVLRAKIGDKLILFNGEGGQYRAVITAVDKKKVSVQIEKFDPKETESPLKLTLAQGISRGEKMDYTIQKAVELGVDRIIPLFTERSTVKLDAERKEKRQQHWQSIVVSACEQSGRNKVPEVAFPQQFVQWLPTMEATLCFVLDPVAPSKLNEISLKNNHEIVLLIGPEGGLSEKEIFLASQKGFLPLNLGPRILRTETAAVAAITALQCLFGDMAR